MKTLYPYSELALRSEFMNGRMPSLLVALLVLCSPVARAARKPTKARKSDADDIKANRRTIAISATVTPLAVDQGAQVDDADRMEACGDMLNVILVELELRMQDGQIHRAGFSRERGEQEQNPHLQAIYEVDPGDMTSTEEVKILVKREKQWLKDVVERATNTTSRILLKQYKQKDLSYGYGYIQKDTGQAHYRIVSVGFSSEDLEHVLNHYRAKAAGCAFASCKMNKNPLSRKKQLTFKVTNLLVLAAWFIQQHKLTPLARYLTLSLTMAYALETGNYILDDSLIIGRSGATRLDPERTQAMFELSVAADVSQPSATVPLIETVLYGAPLPPNHTHDDECRRRGLPTPSELIANVNLAGAKEVCAASLRSHLTQSITRAPRAPNGGKFLVVDFLSSTASASAAALMREAGIESKTIFRTDQMANACGYLAADWACMARARGMEFDGLDEMTTRSANEERRIHELNFELGIEKPNAGSAAVWLLGEQILEIATAINPDGPGRNAAWLSGPGPFNFWRDAFQQSLTDETQQGIVHLWVVNTASQYSSQDDVGGEHWFFVAWLVNAHEPSA